MFNRLFGQYLWKKGLLTTTQLEEVLQLEESTRVKIGVLAVNSGYMAASQIEEVHELQSIQDKKFGEIAIEKGYITEQQLDGLLGQQKKSHLLLSQTILDKGYMSLEQIGQSLQEYKTESGLTEDEISANDPDKIVRKVVSLATGENQENYYNYISLLVKSIVRFLDCQPLIETTPQEIAKPWYIVQKITGPLTFTTVLAMDETALINIGAKFSGEELDSCDEMAQASVAEFLNQYNGIFVVNMSNAGVELSLQPQFLTQEKPENLDSANIIPFDLPLGKMTLYLS